MLLLLVVVILLCAWSLVAAGEAPRRRHRDPFDAPSAAAATPPHQPVAPPATQSPLAPALAAALDRVLPPPVGELRPVTWTHDEVRELAQRVARRINNRTPGLGLEVVSFERVTKTVDSKRTLRYELDAQVYARSRNISARITLKVDSPVDAAERIRDIAVHGARVDTSQIAGSGGLASHVDYASYEPVVRYEPRLT